MAQDIYRIQTVRTEMLISMLPEEETAVHDHFAYLKQLTEQGIVHLAGRTPHTDASSFGIVIFSADSDEAAAEIMNNDPAVQRRVMRAELFPFRTALLNFPEETA